MSEPQKSFVENPNPWHPMTDTVDIKHLGKLNEELSECLSASSRCLIQGIEEKEPSTGKQNRVWLEDEIADVLANLELVIRHFNLDRDSIERRATKKRLHLSQWHKMA